MNLEKASVSLAWVLSGVGAIVVGVATGAFWVASVDNRLSRIEDALKINHVSDIIQSATASENN